MAIPEWPRLRGKSRNRRSHQGALEFHRACDAAWLYLPSADRSSVAMVYAGRPFRGVQGCVQLSRYESVDGRGARLRSGVISEQIKERSGPKGHGAPEQPSPRTAQEGL